MRHGGVTQADVFGHGNDDWDEITTAQQYGEKLRDVRQDAMYELAGMLAAVDLPLSKEQYANMMGYMKSEGLSTFTLDEISKGVM